MTHDIREDVAPEERLAAAEEPALWDVVDELIGEAEFLLGQWLAATGSLRFNLDLLQASIEPRLAAQLDALAVGGEAVAARVLWPTLIEDGDSSVCRRAAAGLALLWEPDGDACDRLIALLDSPAEAKLRRAIGLALRLTARGDIGFTGQVVAVDACVQHLDHEHRPTARWAVEAISHITGLPLEDDRFAQAPKPPNEEDHAGPTDQDDLEEDLTLAPTEGLPNPAADSIRAWWAERRSSFDSQQRYLRGRSFSSAALEATCGNWPLHRFGSIVSEIAIRTSGELVFEPLRLRYKRPPHLGENNSDPAGHDSIGAAQLMSTTTPVRAR